MHLASQHLAHRCHTKGVNLRHSASEFLRKVTATQMNVEHSSLDISMPSKSRDLVNVPVGSRQIGQAQVSQRMGSEPWQIAFARYTFDHFRPRLDRNRFPQIPIRLGQEQATPFSAQFPALTQVSAEEFARWH